MIRNNNYYFSKHMNTLLWYAWISTLLNSGTSICLTSMPCACPGAPQDILILCQSCKPKFSLEAIIDWFVRPINLWPFGCKYSFRNIILQLHWQAWNVLLTFVCIKLSDFEHFCPHVASLWNLDYHQHADWVWCVTKSVWLSPFFRASCQMSWQCSRNWLCGGTTCIRQ